MHAVFLVPKADLIPPSGPCINELQGMFTAGTRSRAPTCLLANSAVTAVVDWTPAGSHGKLRAVSFLTSATSTAHAGEQRVHLVETKQHLGTFHLGCGTIIAAIAPVESVCTHDSATMPTTDWIFLLH
jgi:hypothetical protein